MSIKLFFRNLGNFFYDKVVTKNKKSIKSLRDRIVKTAERLKKARITLRLVIKLLLAVALIVSLVSGDSVSGRTLLLLALVLFIYLYDEYQQIDWKTRARKRMYDRLKKKTGVDYFANKEKIKKKKNKEP